MAAILSAEHLSKSYTLKKLLTDVTIYVGELLSGLDEPDGGVVMRKNGLRVSYLPQMPDYSQPRTAVQQVLFDAPKDVGAPDEYEAKSLLSQFGIDDFDADVRTLSGGQKKRVALAAALIRPVDLLMLDEPSLGLAPLVVQGIFDIIRTVNDQGVTVLLIEQNANMALKIADVGYVLETGRITLTGSGEELLTNDAVRAAYLGA